MRIIKYIFLLILLSSIAVAVYVATQKSEFKIEKTVFINVPKQVVFNYMNDYKNWEDWGAWKEDDADMVFVYPEKTVGLGASYSWNGKIGDGKTTTTFVKENDSIAQKTMLSANETFSFLSFKNTNKGTKVTWTAKGNVDFMTKVYATFSGGLDNLMGEIFERSLNNLNKLITKEINSFDVKVNGIVQKSGGFYVQQSTVCKTSEFQNRLSIMLPKIIYFFKNNNLVMNGKPFVIYNYKSNDTLKFSVCGPLKEEIFISDGSDISTGFLEPFSALKTTLTGDYSHKNTAKKKTQDYLSDNKIELNSSIKDIEIYVKSATDTKHPSQWQTEIMTPVKSKIVAPVTPKPTETKIETPKTKEETPEI